MARRNELSDQRLHNLHQGMSFYEYSCDCRKPKHFQMAMGNVEAICERGNFMSNKRAVTIAEYFDL